MSEHKKHFAICVDNSAYEASLVFRKIYEIIPDELGAKEQCRAHLVVPCSSSLAAWF